MGKPGTPIPPNQQWEVLFNERGKANSQNVLVALLMDIRSELQKLNKTLTEASIFVNGKVG